jgi:glycosyltransferase involved in cell wall biosynthesis
MSKTLSVCLIVKNEENNLNACLDSIKKYADEIIIVDTGSSDNTVEIAQKYTEKVFHFDWIDDFATARNYSISKATSDYILSIDADEVLLNGEIIKNFINNQAKDYGGWLVNLDSTRRTNNQVHTYTSQLLRLFKNDKNIKFSGVIHEQIINSILSQNLKIGNSDIKIEHLGYDLDDKALAQKQERNLNLLLKHIDKNPDDSYNLFNLGKTYFAKKDIINAEKYFQKVIEIAEKSGVIYPSALNYYAVLLFQKKEFQKAKELALESLSINPNQSFANYIIGDIYNELGQNENALEHYLNLEKEINNPTNLAKIIGDYHLPLSQVYFRIGRSFININKLEQAKNNFEKGLSENPKDRNCLIGLSDYFLRNNNFDKSIEIIEKAISFFPEDLELKNIKNIIKDKTNYYKNKSMNEKSTNKISSVADLRNRIKIKQSVTKDKPLLTLSMIVKNEEDMLEDCLKSVQGLVDEIVIVDTGSTDKTLEIAKKYDAKIHHFKWVDDFAIARNEALKYSTGEWILYLDADERIDRDYLIVDKLRNDLKNADKNLGGIIITIESDHSNMDGSTEKHRGGYPRLFRNLGYPKVYFKGRVHEQITPSLMENNLGMISSDIKIIHEGYNIPEKEMQVKLKRNYTLLLKHVQEEPLNGYAWYQLGQTLGRLQLMKESEDAINMAIKCDNLSPSVYASAASTLSQYAGNQKKYKDALHWADESLKKAPKQIYGLNLKGYALLELGKKAEAKELFEQAHQLWKSQQNSVPQSGFDIMIKEEVILNGLRRASS